MIHNYLRIICSCCGERFDVPLYCGNRFCPICGYARRLRIRSRLQFLIENVNFQGDESIKHVTLTIPNQDDLPKMIIHLVQAFRKIRQTPFWKRHVSGGAFVIEITGKANDWHGHIHCVCQSGFIPWTQLRDLWKRHSGGIGVYITRIPKKAAVNYLTKYLSKSEVSEADQVIVSYSLKGMRFFQPFGLWYKIDRLYPKPKKACRSCNEISPYCLAYEMVGGSMSVLKDVSPQAKGPPIVNSVL